MKQVVGESVEARWRFGGRAIHHHTSNVGGIARRRCRPVPPVCEGFAQLSFKIRRMALDFSSLEGALYALRRSLAVRGDESAWLGFSDAVRDTLHAGIIQNFEVAYE